VLLGLSDHLPAAAPAAADPASTPCTQPRHGLHHAPAHSTRRESKPRDTRPVVHVDSIVNWKPHTAQVQRRLMQGCLDGEGVGNQATDNCSLVVSLQAWLHGLSCLGHGCRCGLLTAYLPLLVVQQMHELGHTATRDVDLSSLMVHVPCSCQGRISTCIPT
jgi:hypothetical protein